MKKLKSLFINSLGVLSLFIIGFLGVLTIIATDGGIEIKKSFMVAFQKYNSSQIMVQWSYDGETWENGNFPEDVTSTVDPNSIEGIGAAVNNGGLSIVSFDQPNAISFTWGLGAGVWDKHASPNTSAPTASGPSMAYVGNNKWLVAYKRNDETITVGVFDNTEQRFVSEIPLYDNLNTIVEGRSSLIKKGNKVIVVWRKWVGSYYTLASAIINIENENFILDQIKEIDLSFIDGFMAGIQCDPDITVANDQFLVSFIKEQSSTGTLHGWRAIVIKSSDGNTWQQHSVATPLNVHNQTMLNISGFKNGTLVMAGIRKNASNDRTSLTAAIYKESDGGNWNWSEINAEHMFGTSASYKQFTLVSRAGTQN